MIEEWSAILDPLYQAYSGLPILFLDINYPADSTIQEIIHKKIIGILHKECNQVQIKVAKLVTIS